jgi:hypothetical protein
MDKVALKKTVFIGGCPRSGTTMLGSILGSSARCIVTPESPFKHKIPYSLIMDIKKGLPKLEFLQKLSSNFKFKLWDIQISKELKLPDKLFAQDYQSFLYKLVNEYAVANNRSEWTTWVDHTPDNIQNASFLLSIFTNAKFVHLVRDPRAVASSVLSLDWGPNTVSELIVFWAQQLSFGLALEKAHPDKCLRVYYEDVITKPKETITKVCEFCHITYEETMLFGAAFKVPKYTLKQHALVGQYPDSKRLLSWQDKLSPWQIYQIEKNLGDLMVWIGYSKTLESVPPLTSKFQHFANKIFCLLFYFKKIKYKIKQIYYFFNKN